MILYFAYKEKKTPILAFLLPPPMAQQPPGRADVRSRSRPEGTPPDPGVAIKPSEQLHVYEILFPIRRRVSPTSRQDGISHGLMSLTSPFIEHPILTLSVSCMYINRLFVFVKSFLGSRNIRIEPANSKYKNGFTLNLFMPALHVCVLSQI